MAVWWRTQKRMTVSKETMLGLQLCTSGGEYATTTCANPEALRADQAGHNTYAVHLTPNTPPSSPSHATRPTRRGLPPVNRTESL